MRTPGGPQATGPSKQNPAAGPAFSDEPLFPTSPSTPSYSPPSYGGQPSYSQPASNFGGGNVGGGQYGNPYAATSYGGGYVAHGPANRTWQYITLGVIFILMSVLLFLSVISSVVFGAMNIVNGAPEEFAGAHIIRIVAAFVITLPVATVYLMGGLAFSRQSGLSAAKTVAVVACIPCFNCLILTPFGIWAAVLAFGDAGRKDFHN